MACRFPGAKSTEEFWQNLRDGVSSVSVFSDEEAISAGANPAWQENPSYVKAGPVLEDIEMFDAGFFGFRSREAKMLDPQHRFFLECAWEALESSGHDPGRYEGLIGVYAGAGMNYYVLNNLYWDPEFMESVGGRVNILDSMPGFRMMAASDKDYLPTRVSFLFDLKGPSIGIQTACSSALVAVHVAAQSLLNGECDLALAGGVSIRVPQQAGYLYHGGWLTSPDGHCRSFDAEAGGTVFGNGVGIVVLKRLADALADRDVIHAVIKGSAVSNDGAAKEAYMPPGEEGTFAAAAEALAVSGVDAETITYLEAQGIGIGAADQIEISALTRAFRTRTARTGFCGIGSVKPNIGHLQIAAGSANLIKAVLALKNRMLPPTLNFRNPNPGIDFESSPFRVVDRLTEWETNGLPRRAGVNSMAVGGTTAHVILEEAPAPAPVANDPERPLHLLTLSAKSELALRDLARRYTGYLVSHPESSLADICYTANTGRARFDYRLAVPAESHDALRRDLEAYAEGPDAAPGACKCGKIAHTGAAEVVFLFTGEAAPTAGPGRELFRTQPSFRRAVERCDELLRPQLGKSILEAFGPGGEPDGPDKGLVWPASALFCLQYALASLWRSWGVAPSACVGQGLGEYVAACIAGDRSLEEGLRLVADRARPAPATSGEEEMMAKALREHGSGVFLEIGPGHAGREALPSGTEIRLPSLAQGRPEWRQMLESLGELFVRGVPVDWAGFDGDYSRRKVELPTYPFQRKRYWIEPSQAACRQPVPGRGEVDRGAVAPAMTPGEPAEQSPAALAVGESRDLVVARIRGHVGRVLTVAPEGLDVDAPFHELGLDSLTTVEVKLSIEGDFRFEIPMAVLVEEPSISKIASFVAERRMEDRTRHGSSTPSELGHIVPVQPTGSRMPLFLVAAGHGDLLAFRELASFLGPDQPLYGLEPSGAISIGTSPDVKLSALVSQYVDQMRAIQPDGPYLLGGYSIGGTVAFETGRELGRRGAEVSRLILLDAPYRPIWMSIGHTLLERILEETSILRRLRESKSQKVRRFFHTFTDEGQKAHMEVTRGYVPREFPSRIALFQPALTFTKFFFTRTHWRKASGGRLDVRRVPGTHYRMLRGRHVGELGKRLRKYLEDILPDS